MAGADKELEEQLLEAGNKLVDPPSSVEELLALLEQVESCLSRVEQSPTDSMQNALSPSLKALIAEKLLRHSDDDVKIAVASCISEITRITAPEAPYDDDQMKEVFQLIVSSFENLHDKLSQTYPKRISILETVAKVRSCVVMLDLECDVLILEMFQHFLKAIREHHPENVFSSMETIMTLVLEESEDISLDLLSPLLASIKKDNKEVFPIAQKLGERVLESCATKLKPYLVQSVKSLGISVDDYSAVLASICQDTSDDLEKNDTCVTSEHVEDKSESAKQSLEESTHVVKKDSREVTSSQQENPDDVNKSPKSVMSNGVACVGEDNALADSESIKKKEDADCSNHSDGLNTFGHGVHNDLDIEKVDNSKQKTEKATKKQRKKSSSSTKSAKPSKGQVATNEKETEKMLDCESNCKIVHSSPHEDHSVEAAGPSENDKEIDANIMSPKACNDDSEIVASPPSESLCDENHSKKLGQSKKKDDPVKEGTAEDVSKLSASDSEAKPTRHSVKKALGQKSDVKKTSVVDSVKKGSGAANDADAKKHSAKKSDENKKGSGGSSSRQMEYKKKGGRGKANSEADVAKSSDVDKEMVSSPTSGTKSTKDGKSEETPKTNVKRKRTPGKENDSDVKEYGENLVGLRVKVWWPKDHEFYIGVIDSFDSAKKKHKVLYDDGDEETLNLVKEKWKVIEADSDADEEERSDRADLDVSTDMSLKKKGKTSAGESTKQGKMDASSKSGGAAASNRSKGASTKSSQKAKDGNKSKGSKANSKSEDKVSRKSKDGTPKSGSSKSIVAAKKMSNKLKNTDTSKTSESKDDDSSKPKPSAKSKHETLKSGKSKQETPKAAISKGKPVKSGGKTDVNGTGKVKSGLLKRKHFENENSDVSAGEIEDSKGKTASSSKAQGSELKSRKRRKT
ncbi:nucleolar protein dao-5-like isoform X1 [Glycine soja]|uniref:Sister chromatid cohesion protein PDS5-like B-B isoform A n=3 Tax=Glycine soja TaxID=3848 RepID=A0A445KWJ9_GLYSO|nr:nucleolar protein dao-5-like isoform X1 [Glycine soja]KHN29621.1 Sister chromatid cohesion protein PDS5 like B-B [Glycine soja]RZC15267.1 Sister chromatid cohesion protein PDS5-like B-B isoform A [Glycine soja]RZC15269.1 Sister chromatid cohesion protein PDS5-like B-B isoform C [Glycine soja]